MMSIHLLLDRTRSSKSEKDYMLHNAGVKYQEDMLKHKVDSG